MAIKKGSFTFEFMYDDAVDSDEEVRGMEFDDIMTATMCGAMIGSLTSPLVLNEVAPEDVRSLLLEWQNDGTFFDSDDE